MPVCRASCLFITQDNPLVLPEAYPGPWLHILLRLQGESGRRHCRLTEEVVGQRLVLPAPQSRIGTVDEQAAQQCSSDAHPTVALQMRSARQAWPRFAQGQHSYPTQETPSVSKSTPPSEPTACVPPTITLRSRCMPSQVPCSCVAIPRIHRWMLRWAWAYLSQTCLESMHNA